MGKNEAIILDPKDNVATMLGDVDCGNLVSIVSKAGDAMKVVRAKQSIPFAHKVALKRIAKDEEIIKYGEVIGVATELIEIGEHVHIHNVVSMILR